MTKAQQMVSFDDAVCTFKSQIKVLKEHIFVKRVQNDAYNKHKAELSDGDLLVHVDFAESYRNDQQNEIQSAYFGNQRFLLFTSCCYSSPKHFQSTNLFERSMTEEIGV